MYNMGLLITFAAFANKSIVLCNSKTRAVQQSILYKTLYYILIYIVNLNTIKQQQSVAERNSTQQCSFHSVSPTPPPKELRSQNNSSLTKAPHCLNLSRAWLSYVQQQAGRNSLVTRHSTRPAQPLGGQFGCYCEASHLA